MILVVGATGAVGGHVCALARKESRAVRGLVRPQSDPNTVASLKKMGVETITGDLKDPASLEAACAGVTAVVATASSMPAPKEGDTIGEVDRDGHIALVEAAKKAGVKKYVYVSFMRPVGLHYPLADAKAAVEQAIQSSGFDYTILQASFFNETWLNAMVGFDWASGAVRIYGDGQQGICFVALKDVARMAFASLDDAKASNKIIKVGGPKSVKPADVVKEFEKRTGKSIQVENVPEEALRGQLGGASNPVEASFAGLMVTYAMGDGIDPAESRAVFGNMGLTSVADAVAELTQSGW